MSLVQLYSRQYPWRRWAEIYPDLGDLSGRQVIDLGCGIGDQARDLSARGARVLGLDTHPDAIAHARSRHLPRARFVCDRIENLGSHVREAVDGIWSSFVAAYFPEFGTFLAALGGALKPGGWLALTELDDLFGHDPLDPRWRTLVEEYYSRSLADGFYRFRSHDPVRSTLEKAGWRIAADRDLADDEFCFSGRAPADVAEGWRQRLEIMMPRFTDRFGHDAAGFDTAFRRCLDSEEHRSRSRLWFILARAPEAP